MQKNFGRVGFIMSVLGSSIGLGHIWRFPSMVGDNGGSAFVLLFLAISIVIGGAMLIAEMLIGQYGRTNVPDSFKVITGNKDTKWRFVGITLIGGPIILTFYCAVLGWILYYLVSVSFNLPINFEDSQAIFVALSSSNDKLGYQVLCLFIILFTTAYSIANGIKSIEKLNFVLMPLLFFIFMSLLIYAFCLPSFGQAFDFMFNLDISKINSSVLIAAMGQVFFSLSIGAGSIITYAAHSDKEQNLLSSALWILFPGIFISLVAGLVIFTFIFEYNTASIPSAGPGLVFMALPLAFAKFGFLGNCLYAIFMIGLLFAGISSTVSLLEPCVKYLEDKTKYSRKSIAYGLTLFIFIIGIIVVLSMNENYSSLLTFFGKSLFDWADWISANLILTWGAFFGSLFIGYFIPKDRTREWTKGYFKSELSFFIWRSSLRVLAPLMVVVIFCSNIISLFK